MCFEYHDDSDESLEIVELLLLRYLVMKYTNGKQKLSKIINLNKTIDDFGFYCKKKFRFESSDLKDLVRLLKFPDVVTFANGITMTGEETFLRGLYELRSGNTNDDIAGKTIYANRYHYLLIYMYFNVNHYCRCIWAELFCAITCTITSVS